MGLAGGPRLVLDILERHDAGGDALGATLGIGDASRLEGELVLPQAEGRIPAEGNRLSFLSGCISVPSAPWPDRPATTQGSVSPSSGNLGTRST